MGDLRRVAGMRFNFDSDQPTLLDIEVGQAADEVNRKWVKMLINVVFVFMYFKDMASYVGSLVDCHVHIMYTQGVKNEMSSIKLTNSALV